jgi:hypothetical protein
MELDELKNLWKKQGESFRPRNEMEIAAMLNGKSRSIITKLKRSVWIELCFTLIAGVALLVYAFTLEASALRTVSIAILVVFVGYTVYYIKKLMLLSKFDTSEKNIRSNLESLIKNLSDYLKYYRMSYTILYPVYFLLGVIMGGLEQGSDHFFDLLTETRTILLLLGFALLFYFTSTWLVNWLLKKLYGTHLEKLKSLLNDIHDESQAA